MPNKNGQPTEAEEQAALFQWAAYYPELRFMYAVPNGGSRNVIEARNLKRQGVKSGVPDICLPVAAGGYHGLYIELKVGKNKPSENQEHWLEYLNKAGYMTKVCYGFQEARETIAGYISNRERSGANGI